MGDRETPEKRPVLPGWSLLASAVLHGLVALVLLLIALLSFAPLPEEPVLRVTVLQEGPGAAGAAGGAQGGGGDRKATSSAPAAEQTTTQPPTEAPTETQEQETPPRPVQAAAAPARQPVRPLPQPPRHKPSPPRPRPVPAERPAPAPPIPEPPQLAQAPAPQPVEAAPGIGNGLGDAVGTGTGAQGAGHGAIGNGPIEGPGDDYLDRLRRWLNRYKRYPQAAAERKQEGGLTVSFTILRDGTVIDPRIEQSSGFPLLDEAALQMLRDASPVPPLPATYRAERVGIDLPVDFKIGLFQRLF